MYLTQGSLAKAGRTRLYEYYKSPPPNNMIAHGPPTSPPGALSPQREAK